jgi:hypothetical protein
VKEIHLVEANFIIKQPYAAARNQFVTQSVVQSDISVQHKHVRKCERAAAGQIE